MTALIASELLKLRTTRASIGYLIVLLLLAGGGAAGQVGTSEDRGVGRPALPARRPLERAFAGLLALLDRSHVVTVEWRHGTITGRCS